MPRIGPSHHLSMEVTMRRLAILVAVLALSFTAAPCPQIMISGDSESHTTTCVPAAPVPPKKIKTTGLPVPVVLTPVVVVVMLPLW